MTSSLQICYGLKITRLLKFLILASPMYPMPWLELQSVPLAEAEVQSTTTEHYGKRRAVQLSLPRNFAQLSNQHRWLHLSMSWSDYQVDPNTSDDNLGNQILEAKVIDRFPLSCLHRCQIGHSQTSVTQLCLS